MSIGAPVFKPSLVLVGQRGAVGGSLASSIPDVTLQLTGECGLQVFVVNSTSFCRWLLAIFECPSKPDILFDVDKVLAVGPFGSSGHVTKI